LKQYTLSFTSFTKDFPKISYSSFFKGIHQRN